MHLFTRIKLNGLHNANEGTITSLILSWLFSTICGAVKLERMFHLNSELNEQRNRSYITSKVYQSRHLKMHMLFL